MHRTISIISLGIALATMQASIASAADKVIPRKDLPATLKGGKMAKASDGIPSCTKGRALLPLSDSRLTDWAEGHPDHACANAAQVYVCRVAGNLSVRCE